MQPQHKNSVSGRLLSKRCALNVASRTTSISTRLSVGGTGGRTAAGTCTEESVEASRISNRAVTRVPPVHIVIKIKPLFSKELSNPNQIFPRWRSDKRDAVARGNWLSQILKFRLFSGIYCGVSDFVFVDDLWLLFPKTWTDRGRHSQNKTCCHIKSRWERRRN